MQEAWHKASPNNRTPLFSLTPSLTPSPTSSPWASLFPSSSVPSSCNLVLIRELLFSSCEAVESFLESHWWEKAPCLVLLPFHQLFFFFFSRQPDGLISGLSTSCPVAFFTCADGEKILCVSFSLRVGQENWFSFVHTWSDPMTGIEHICVCLGWCWWSHYQFVLPHLTIQHCGMTPAMDKCIGKKGTEILFPPSYGRMRLRAEGRQRQKERGVRGWGDAHRQRFWDWAPKNRLNVLNLPPSDQWFEVPKKSFVSLGIS